MTFSHNSLAAVERPFPADAFIGLPGRFANLLAGYASPGALLVGFLTWVGTCFGHSVHTTFRGQEIYPNLFTFLISPPLGHRAVLRILERFFTDCEPPIRVVNAGIKTALSLIHLVRGELERWERLTTRAGEPAEFAPTLVDGGVSEKRLLVTQGTLSRLVWKKTKSGTGLSDTLVSAFYGEDLSDFMTYRDGGRLESRGAHIATLGACSKSDVLDTTQTFRDACLFIANDAESVFADVQVNDRTEYLLIQTECLIAMQDAPGAIPLTGSALRMIEQAAFEFPPVARGIAAHKMVKLALSYAALECAGNIEAKHAAAAIAVLKESHRVMRASEVEAGLDIVEVAARRIEDALRAAPDGLSATQLNGIFHRNLEGSVMKAAKEKLLAEGRVKRRTVRAAKGRPKVIWSIRGGK